MLSIALILIGFIYLPPGEPQPQAPPVLEFVIPMQPVEEPETLLCPCVAA